MRHSTLQTPTFRRTMAVTLAASTALALGACNRGGADTGGRWRR